MVKHSMILAVETGKDESGVFISFGSKPATESAQLLGADMKTHFAIGGDQPFVLHDERGVVIESEPMEEAD